MHTLRNFCLFASVVFYSCSNSSENQTRQSFDTINTDTIKPAETLQAKPSLNHDDVYFYYELVVIEETNLQKDSIQNSEAIIPLHIGDQLKIIDQSNMAQEDENDQESSSCRFGHYMYYVITTDKKEGWVYGNRIVQKVKSMYNKNLEPLQKLVGEEITQGNSSYYFDAGITLAKDPADEMGCGKDCIPFFYDKSGKILMINTTPEMLASGDDLVRARGDLLIMTLDSDGGSATIKEIVKDPTGATAPQFKCNHYYQDGGATSTLYLKFSTDHFTVENYELKKDSY